MHARHRWAVLLLALFPSTLAAQAMTHEYRPVLSVTLPRWRGVGVTLAEEQHFAMRDAEQVEHQEGVGLVSPTFPWGIATAELRLVRKGNGSLEHRWIPAVELRRRLAMGFELRDRVRMELRGIDGAWSTRYRNRTALAHPVDVGGRAVSPYVHYELVYDSRYSMLNRREAAVGVRYPLAGGTSVDWFLMRQTDSRRAAPVLVANGLTLRVLL